MAALAPMETYDILSKLKLRDYHCVYVSYGSYGDKTKPEEQHLYPHANPQFLTSFLNLTRLPYLCISIDPRHKEASCHTYGERNKYTFVTIPVEQIEATGKDYLQVIATHSIAQTRKITKDIVGLLNADPVQYVMFVNFIKFVNLENAGESTLYHESLQLKEDVGGYDYYDWCGFGPYKNYILKSNKKSAIVENLLQNPIYKIRREYDGLIDKLNQNNLGQLNVDNSINECLFPLTWKADCNITFLYYLFPGIEDHEARATELDTAEAKAKAKGGTRKRKRKSKRRNIFITL